MKERVVLIGKIVLHISTLCDLHIQRKNLLHYCRYRTAVTYQTSAPYHVFSFIS
jgi:hypothetical protein